jgi:excisionase family DNA binding protein
MENKDYLTVSQFAEKMGISRQAVLKKIKLNQLKADKIGRYYFILKDNLPSFNKELDKNDKKIIEESVEKVVKEYGEVLKLLGKE